MPLVPITDQERKRMMNELKEIDELEGQNPNNMYLIQAQSRPSVNLSFI